MKKTFSEAIKLKDGVFHNLSYHQQRVDRTQIHFGGGKINLADCLSTPPEEVRNGLFKCRIEYGVEVEKIEFIPYVFRPVGGVTAVANNGIDYRFKSTDRRSLNEMLKASGCSDIIIIKYGFVTDAFASNLVFESKEGLFTPESCLLNGTKRQSLLESKRISARPITIADIKSYDRLYFVNAMIDLEDNISIAIGDIALNLDNL